jgi:hypothetical protein
LLTATEEPNAIITDISRFTTEMVDAEHDLSQECQEAKIKRKLTLAFCSALAEAFVLFKTRIQQSSNPLIVIGQAFHPTPMWRRLADQPRGNILAPKTPLERQLRRITHVFATLLEPSFTNAVHAVFFTKLIARGLHPYQSKASS